jgi:hypothetical protein
MATTGAAFPGGMTGQPIWFLQYRPRIADPPAAPRQNLRKIARLSL